MPDEDRERPPDELHVVYERDRPPRTPQPSPAEPDHQRAERTESGADRIDDASEDSFPASDPPAWTSERT